MFLFNYTYIYIYIYIYIYTFSPPSVADLPDFYFDEIRVFQAGMRLEYISME